MVARVNTVAFQGIEVKPVDVQVQLSNGLPAFNIVGYINFTLTIMLSLLIFVVMFSSNSLAEEYDEVVYHKLNFERVIDGDTFEASGRKIRMWGIDAPEKKHPASYAATMYLEVILEDGILACKFIEKDRYKRDVMHCLINGLDIGSMIVQMGMAKDFKKYSGGYYSYEQDLAKSKSLGIWKKVLNEER